MSHDRSAATDESTPDYYLPGTPDAATVDRVWGFVEVLFRPRGRLRADRLDEFAKR